MEMLLHKVATTELSFGDSFFHVDACVHAVRYRRLMLGSTHPVRPSPAWQCTAMLRLSTVVT